MGVFSDDENAVMGTIVDSVVAAGADRHCSRAATAVGSNNEASLVEEYGRGSIMADANLKRRNLNMRGLAALDLLTLKEDGIPLNLSLKKNRREASPLIA